MKSIEVIASIGFDERVAYLINLYEVGSHEKYMRRRMWVNALYLGLVALFVVCAPFLLIVFLMGLDSSSEAREAAGFFSFFWSPTMIGFVGAVILLAKSYLSMWATPRALAKLSARRQFWTGVKGFCLSSSGIVVRKTLYSKAIEWKKIKDIYLLDEAIYFLMGTKQINVALIPLSAFESQEQIDEALELVGTYWHGEIKTS